MTLNKMTLDKMTNTQNDIRLNDMEPKPGHPWFIEW